MGLITMRLLVTTLILTTNHLSFSKYIRAYDKSFQDLKLEISTPPETLEIRYGNGLNFKTPGSTLNPQLTDELKYRPNEIEFSKNPESFYTVVMLDPDAPSRDNPKCRSWLHWVVVNLEGDAPTCDTLYWENVGEVRGTDATEEHWKS